LSYHFAAITRQGGRADDVSRLPNRFATNALFSPQTQLTLSQLESDIRKKLSPAEADNIVLAASPKNG
jgi:hypothetical protein